MNETLTPELPKHIPPSVGRVLLYYPPGITPPAQPHPAIVSHVHSDTCVNVAIFDGNGRPYMTPPTSVLLVQPGQEPPAGGHYCVWMEFQVAQARKHGQIA